MPVEIEAKIKVEDLAPTRAKLKELKAKQLGDYLELNAIFPDQSVQLKLPSSKRVA